MDSIVFRYRARELTYKDIDLIRDLINEHYARGRSHISRVLCRTWNWFQPNGGLKEYAARDLLLRLEEKQFIHLPPRLRPKNNLKRKRFEKVPVFIRKQLRGRVGEHPRLIVDLASPTNQYLFDYLLHNHHYLGAPGLVGEHVKHLAFIDGQVVACVAWASAAWKVACRDRLIGWDTAVKRKNLHLVANNTRFLILPWIKVEHLASKILAHSLGRLNSDWQNRYNHGIYLAETFVDHSRFKGTCYKAANWRFAGKTRGSAKRGNDYRYHGRPKAIYIYPLHKDFSRKLKR